MFSFLSIEFALAFILFFSIYWAFKAKPQIQNLLLILMSYSLVYLMSSILAIGILFFFSISIYLISVAMERDDAYKKILLILGIFLTVIQLSAFKYYDFFKPLVAEFLDKLNLDSSGLAANIILPLGISYYSFQAISYLVSRYRNETDAPQLNIMQLLMHLSFFSTISAGPIARIHNAKGLTDVCGQSCGMGSQIIISEPRKIILPTIALILLIIALIKKWWIAGWLADEWVNPVFANPMQYHSLEVLAAIYGYTLQLFLDFSGYSEMMVAFGLLLGFRLPVNFKAPLLAHNIRDFWDKWHISLSTWIRDYIYIPLGGSRDGFIRTQFNLVLAMVLSGIWHGYGWNFFIWGLLHGLALVILNISDKTYQRIFKVDAKKARDALAKSHLLGKLVGVFVTITFVSFCFVFFRAKTFEEGLQVFQALFQNYLNIQWTSNPLYLLTLLLLAWLIYPFIYSILSKLPQVKTGLPRYLVIVPLFIIFIFLIICAPSGIPGFIYANF